MKTAIAPLACAILTVVVFRFVVNPDMEPVGYLLTLGFGAFIGVIINTLVFKKEPEEKSEKDTVELNK